MRCLQVCCIECTLAYLLHHLPSTSRTRQHHYCPTHQLQDSHTSHQHPLPAAGMLVQQHRDRLLWISINHQLVQLRPPVLVRVGCQVRGKWRGQRMNLLAEAEYASPGEVGQLLQVTTFVYRGLVHLQQHRKRAGIYLRWVGQLFGAMVRQCLNCSNPIIQTHPPPTLARSCGSEWRAWQECMRLRLSTLLGRQSYTRARASGTRSVRMRPSPWPSAAPGCCCCCCWPGGVAATRSAAAGATAAAWSDDGVPSITTMCAAGEGPAWVMWAWACRWRE